MEFDKALEHFHTELRSIHTNRATPSIVEDLGVDAYGSVMRLQELASITAPEPQQLVIQPWDQTLIKAIETALRDHAGLQLSPVVDGVIIRLHFPPLTEERRREIIKLVHQKAEEARISLRKTREDQLRARKAQQKTGELSEDDYFREEKTIQTEVDRVNKAIAAASEQKEAELLTI